jgi:hypothetical protein
LSEKLSFIVRGVYRTTACTVLCKHGNTDMRAAQK